MLKHGLLNEDLVKSQAKKIDEKRSKNLQKPFCWYSLGIKDIIDTRLSNRKWFKNLLGRKPKRRCSPCKIITRK